MFRIPSPPAELTYAALRFVAGLSFCFHGVQKVFGVLATHGQPPMFTQMWFGGVIELVCGLLLAIGLFTSQAAFLASGTMAVAYMQFHWKFALDQNFFPGVNQGELALVYCFLWLFVWSRGGGRYSIDAKI